MTNEIALNKLINQFQENILGSHEDHGMLIVETNRESIRSIIEFIRDDQELKIDFLTTLCGLHYPANKGKELGVMYQLHSLVNNYRIRFKVFFSVEDPHTPSIQDIYSGANWPERQEFDFFGIKFDGHPNLKRILNVDDMDYSPMRKEYKLEDGTRTDKDDSYFGR
ncbi:MAG: NADH-quinone oxidoreductase subunit C [Chitinophagales bacterium]|nr:NADH-quinone oxidoreductase subunit C [Chitinophagales bacterium]